MNKNEKRALVTGITGQDGAYLARFLLNKGYEVFGTFRRLSTPNFWRLNALNITDKVNLIPCDIVDTASIATAINISEPNEIYHLAAQSFVGASFEQPIGTAEITGLATTKILEAIKTLDKNIKFYQASTSELYGNKNEEVLDENARFRPSSPYAAAKLYAYWTTKIYREGYNMFACNGILFNHESPLRGLEFVTRKVCNEVAKISLGVSDKIVLGNLDAIRDWGYAPEYVESMWMMLQQDEPDDYVVATGEAHSVRELLAEAFSVVNLDWEKYVKLDDKFTRPIDVNRLCGDYSKAKRKLGWEPRTKFGQLIKLMVEEDMKCWKKCLAGEHFPWDAPNYNGVQQLLTRSRTL